MRFVFWQNMLTHHQAPWLARLASHPGVEVTVAAQERMANWRRKCGWEDPDYGLARVIAPLDRGAIRSLLNDGGPRGIHVFSGLGTYPSVHEAFRQCASRKLRIGIMAESREKSGTLEMMARRIRARVQYLRFGGHVDFVLAIGASTAAWFAQSGFDSRSIFEFAYFPPEPVLEETSWMGNWNTSGTRLLYVGRLLRLKGIDLALRALHDLRALDWSLGLVGAGSERARLAEMVKDIGLERRVHFFGMLPNAQAMGLLNTADVLILPSRHDGYGAVVNEALMRGVPVICSDRCGARQVITAPAAGSVFRMDSPDSLAEALRAWILRGRASAKDRESIRSLAAGIVPGAGADYFLEVVRHVYQNGARPVPPWQRG